MEYLGHLFNPDCIIRTISGCYFRCSKCSVILFNGTFIKYAFCNENLIDSDELINISCNEYIVKKLLE